MPEWVRSHNSTTCFIARAPEPGGGRSGEKLKLNTKIKSYGTRYVMLAAVNKKAVYITELHARVRIYYRQLIIALIKITN